MRTCLQPGTAATIGNLSLDHLVGACHQCRGHRNSQGIGGLEIDHQLELCRLLDRDVSDLGATEELGDLSGVKVAKLNEAWSIGGKAAFLR